MDIRETRAGVDWLLRTMVNFSNHSEQDVSLAMTSSVKGSIITGEIISAHEYLKINEQISLRRRTTVWNLLAALAAQTADIGQACGLDTLGRGTCDVRPVTPCYTVF